MKIKLSSRVALEENEVTVIDGYLLVLLRLTMKDIVKEKLDLCTSHKEAGIIIVQWAFTAAL